MTPLQQRERVEHRRRPARLRWALPAGLAVLGIAAALLVFVDRPSPGEPASGRTPPAHLEVFSEDSYWRTPLPEGAPIHPDSEEILDYLRTENADDGCVVLSGAEQDRWGMPIYWARPGDPEASVTPLPNAYGLPPEFAALRIPEGAQPMARDDREMVVFDVARGYVASLHRAGWTPEHGWRAAGGSIAYLDSNGLAAALPAADEPRNRSWHRGLNGAVMAVRSDQVARGAIDNVIKVGVSGASARHVFPMTGSDGPSEHPHAPAQGTRLRIRPEIDLDGLDLHAEAQVIARALQRYGMVVGDTTTGPIELKLERPAEGPSLWEVSRDGLCAIPLEAFEVIAEGYDPSAPRSAAAQGRARQ